mgnify:CR=1 FL=1
MVASGGAAVNYSTIEGNLCAGVHADEALAGEWLNAKNNWWGNADGPSAAGPGTGDGVNEFVDYVPWVGMPATDDTDFDGLEDDWEETTFGDLSQTAAGDPDHDGWPTLAESQDGELVPSLGVGLRFMVLPAKRINLRLDYARSDGGEAIYFSVGEAF